MDSNSKVSEEKIREVVRQLRNGNWRYVNGKMENYKNIRKQRSDCVNGQNPHTTVIACSDSRVIPEMIFDQGPSKIFSIETAGNILDDISMGSVEYGVLHTHTPVLMIMAHTNCGAVTATYDSKGKTNDGYIKYIVKKIGPAFVDGFYDKKDECIYSAIIQNAENVAKEILEKSKGIKSAYDKGNVALLITLHHLNTGKVELIRIMHPTKWMPREIENEWNLEKNIKR